jgi:hypothetical protein
MDGYFGSVSNGYGFDPEAFGVFSTNLIGPYTTNYDIAGTGANVIYFNSSVQVPVAAENHPASVSVSVYISY